MTRRPRGMATEELVREFFLATEKMPREAAAEIAGVCLGTLNRWERSAPRQVKLAVRNRLLEYLFEAERIDADGGSDRVERGPRIPILAMAGEMR